MVNFKVNSRWNICKNVIHNVLKHPLFVFSKHNRFFNLFAFDLNIIKWFRQRPNFCCRLSCFQTRLNSLDKIAQVYLLWRLKKTENYTVLRSTRDSLGSWFDLNPEQPRLSSAWIKSMGNLLNNPMENVVYNVFLFFSPFG